MTEPRDQPVPEPDGCTEEPVPVCPCGSREHQGVRIGEWLSPSGPGLGGVYVCPERSPSGLEGAL